MPLLTGLAKLADRVTHSWSTRVALNHLLLHRYGTMTHLTIDSATKTIDLELQLLGENAPIHVHVERYSFEKLPTGDARLTVTGVTVSRAWMQELARNFAESKPLLVPAEMAGYLGMIL